MNILEGEGQQVYVFDLRSAEDYNNGHILGAINVEFDPKDAESFIERIPSDWSVYVIGDDEAEAKVMAEELKKIDEYLFVYTIEGGYEALLNVEGIETYITNKPGELREFTRTEAKEKADSVLTTAV